MVTIQFSITKIYCTIIITAGFGIITIIIIIITVIYYYLFVLLMLHILWLKMKHLCTAK